MAVETLVPNTIIASTNVTGALTDIDEGLVQRILGITGIYECWHMVLCQGTWRATTSEATSTGLLTASLASLKSAQPTDSYFLTNVVGLVQGLNMAQATDGLQPQHTTMVQGWPTVDFDGSNDRMLSPDYSPTLAPPNTGVLVMRALSVVTSARRDFVSSGFSGASEVQNILYNTSGNYQIEAPSVSSTTAVDTAAIRVLTAEWNGTSTRILRENSVLASGGTTAVHNMRRTRLGCDHNTANFSNFRLCSYYVVNGLLSADDRQLIIDLEKAIWGF